MVANRSAFAVIPMEGFNPERAKILKEGIELTLGTSIRCAAILDRDYRSLDECAAVTAETEKFCSVVAIHKCKEIENFMLVPSALERAIDQRIADRENRTGGKCARPHRRPKFYTLLHLRKELISLAAILRFGSGSNASLIPPNMTMFRQKKQ